MQPVHDRSRTVGSPSSDSSFHQLALRLFLKVVVIGLQNKWRRSHLSVALDFDGPMFSGVEACDSERANPERPQQEFSLCHPPHLPILRQHPLP